MEHFELSRRKVLGKSWIFCDDHPPVETDKECEDGCGHLDWNGLWSASRSATSGLKCSVSP